MSNFLRPGWESHPRIAVLQTAALLLGYQANYRKLKLSAQPPPLQGEGGIFNKMTGEVLYILLFSKQLVNFLPFLFTEVNLYIYERNCFYL